MQSACRRNTHTSKNTSKGKRRNAKRGASLYLQDALIMREGQAQVRKYGHISQDANYDFLQCKTRPQGVTPAKFSPQRQERENNGLLWVAFVAAPKDFMHALLLHSTKRHSSGETHALATFLNAQVLQCGLSKETHPSVCNTSCDTTLPHAIINGTRACMLSYETRRCLHSNAFVYSSEAEFEEAQCIALHRD